MNMGISQTKTKVNLISAKLGLNISKEVLTINDSTSINFNSILFIVINYKCLWDGE